MKYDFTTKLDRQGTDAYALEAVGKYPGVPEAPKEGFSFIPMWVADMNFATCPAITAEIIKRAEHPAFGYYITKKEYFDAIISWQEKRNGVTGLTRKDIGYENGVLGGITTAMRVLAAPGDAVLLHSPCYIGFSNCLLSNGWKMVLSPLKKDENGIYRMDYEDMEKKIRENHIHVTVFSNPHNPAGRVWEKEELERAGEIFERNGVTVISDEIWSDIIMEGYHHTPVQMVNDWFRDNTIAFYAPSKTFNLAGLVGSYHIIYNKTLRDRVVSAGSKTFYNEMNILSMHALLGAYSQAGEEWTDELRQTLTGNVTYACAFIREHFEGVEVTKPQGTYMLFLDCTKWCSAHHEDVGAVLKRGWDVGVGWQDGRPFHGKCHIRMNLALPLSYVKEAFDRLEKYVFTD